MVSELSKRLMGGSNSHSFGSPHSSLSGASRPPSDSSSTLSSSSSISDAMDSRMPIVDVPQSSPFLSETKIENDPLQERDNCFKRRKIDELRFAASRVKEDLEKGGLPFPSIHINKPRALEGYDIDMSSIQLLAAKSVSDSPFLTNAGVKRSFENICEFEQLFSQTQEVYSKRWLQDTVRDWGERSSAGSLTSDSECSLTLDIPPRLDDGLNRSSLESTIPDSTKTSKSITIGEALGNNSEPRYVPYCIAVLFLFSFPPFDLHFMLAPTICNSDW